MLTSKSSQLSTWGWGLLLLLAAPALLLLEKEEEVCFRFCFFIWIIIGKRLPLLQSYAQKVISILSKLTKTNMKIHLKLFSQSSKVEKQSNALAYCLYPFNRNVTIRIFFDNWGLRLWIQLKIVSSFFPITFKIVKIFFSIFTAITSSTQKFTVFEQINLLLLYG